MRSEISLVKITHCWKSHDAAHLCQSTSMHATKALASPHQFAKAQ